MPSWVQPLACVSQALISPLSVARTAQLPLLLPPFSMLPLFATPKLKVWIVEAAFKNCPMRTNLDGWVQMDDRAMKSSRQTRRWRGGRWQIGPPVNNQHAWKQWKAQAAEPPPEKGTRNKRWESKWKNHYLSSEGHCRSDYWQQTPKRWPEKGRGEKRKGSRKGRHFFILF